MSLLSPFKATLCAKSTPVRALSLPVSRLATPETRPHWRLPGRLSPSAVYQPSNHHPFPASTVINSTLTSTRFHTLPTTTGCLGPHIIPGLLPTKPWVPPTSNNYPLSGMLRTTTYVGCLFSTQHPTTEPTPQTAFMFFNTMPLASMPFISTSVPRTVHSTSSSPCTVYGEATTPQPKFTAPTSPCTLATSP